MVNEKEFEQDICGEIDKVKCPHCKCKDSGRKVMHSTPSAHNGHLYQCIKCKLLFSGWY